MFEGTLTSQVGLMMLLRCQVLVKGVLWKHRYDLIVQPLHDEVTDRCFAGSCSSGNGYHENIAVQALWAGLHERRMVYFSERRADHIAHRTRTAAEE